MKHRCSDNTFHTTNKKRKKGQDENEGKNRNNVRHEKAQEIPFQEHQRRKTYHLQC